MNKLVIGCGYLGHRVAAKWRDDGHEVFVLTRSADKAEQFRADGLHPIIGDIMQPDTLRFPAQISTCLYAIALDRSGPHSKREVYVDGLKNILAAPTFQPDRVIYISSTSVYGQAEGDPIDETSETAPTLENGQICLAAETSVRQQTQLPWNVLRLSGIYGPGRLLARKEKLAARETLPGNPEGWLNLIHVDDACQAVLACEAHPEAINELFLISDDRPIRRKEYYTLLAEQFGAPAPVFGDMTTNLGKRCDNSKARERIGFTPSFPSIAEGLPASV